MARSRAIRGLGAARAERRDPAGNHGSDAFSRASLAAATGGSGVVIETNYRAPSGVRRGATGEGAGPSVHLLGAGLRPGPLETMILDFDHVGSRLHCVSRDG